MIHVGLRSTSLGRGIIILSLEKRAALSTPTRHLATAPHTTPAAYCYPRIMWEGIEGGKEELEPRAP